MGSYLLADNDKNIKKNLQAQALDCINLDHYQLQKISMNSITLLKEKLSQGNIAHSYQLQTP